MRTNSFIKLITKELNRELADKNMTNKDVHRKELQAFIDKMKNKIELFVRSQIKQNIVTLVRCKCRHYHSSTSGCDRCKCTNLIPLGRTPLIVSLEDNYDSDEIFHVA